MGRDSSRFRKKGISSYSLSASDSFRNFTVVLILFFKRNNMRFYTEEDILDKHIGKIGVSGSAFIPCIIQKKQ